MGQGPGTKRYNAKQKAKAKTDAEKYLDLAARGWTLSQIARHFGVGKSTVHQRIEAEREKPAANLELYRAVHLQENKRNRRALLRRMADAPEETVTCLMACLRIQEREARLLGTDAPARSIQTEEELETAMNKLRDRLSPEAFEQVVSILADVSVQHGEGPKDGAGSPALPGSDRGEEGGSEGA